MINQIYKMRNNKLVYITTLLLITSCSKWKNERPARKVEGTYNCVVKGNHWGLAILGEPAYSIDTVYLETIEVEKVNEYIQINALLFQFTEKTEKSYSFKIISPGYKMGTITFDSDSLHLFLKSGGNGGGGSVYYDGKR
jgi:hypothetical protein